MKGGNRHTQGIAITLTVVCLAAFGGRALAATAPQVSGTVTTNGSPAANAAIQLVCTPSAGTAHVRNGTTTSTGHYNLSFAAGQCDDGSSVTATATSGDGSNSGQAVGIMGGGGTPQHLVLDVGLTPTTALPEFGIATTIVSVGAAGAAALWLRRRTTSG